MDLLWIYLIQINSDDFVFVDPPYLERLGYTEGDGGLNLHEDLLCCLKQHRVSG
jgi:DNA adenine methylase